MSNVFSFRGVQFRNVQRYSLGARGFEIREEAFPGVDGFVVIRMGRRGADIVIEGWEDDALSTATFIETIRNLIDGQAGVLADRTGNIDNVICVGMDPGVFSGVGGGVYEGYGARFRRVV